MKIDRTELCSNHYIVLTEDPKYKFQFGPAAAQESGAIVIGFNCGNKVMYTSTGNSLEIPCLSQGTTEIRIKISSKGIIFEDDLKCPPLNLQGETTMSNRFYVYLGASQDTADPISTAERMARLQHIKKVGVRNNITLDEEDLNDLKNDQEGPGRYKRSYFRDFSIIKIILPDKFDPETIVVGWGCNTKIAIGISGGQVIKKSNYCPHLGRHRISLDMISQPNHVIFRTVTEQEVQNTAEECDTGIGSLPPPEGEEEGEDGTTKTTIKMERLCPDLVLPSNFSKRGVYYIFSGAGTYPTSDQPITRATVYESIAVDVPVSATRSMKIEDEETLSGTEVRNTELFFSDGFGSETENGIWMGDHLAGHHDTSIDEKTGEHVLIFNDTVLIPKRTRRPFHAPFTMVSDLLKDNKCNNHFFIISTRKVANYLPNVATTGDVSFFFCFFFNFISFFFFVSSP